MAMTKRTVTKYWRRRYARGYRRYRGLSNQYFRAKIEGVYTIAFPAEAGQPVFAETEQSVLRFTQVFSSSQYFGSLIAMFGYMKLTGVCMEVTPGPKNYAGTANVGTKILVGYSYGSSTFQNYNELVANNNSIVLGVDTTKRKYSPAMGANGWLNAGTSESLGAFSVASSLNGTLTTMPTWTCRFSLYLIFKKTNV